MKVLVGMAVLIVLLSLIAVPVLAVHGGGIIVGNEVVLRIRHESNGMTIQQRADAVTMRINKVLGCDCLETDKIKVVKVNNQAAVMYGSDLIVTVDKMTAADNGMTPMQLGKVWADNLKRVLPVAKANNCGASCEL